MNAPVVFEYRSAKRFLLDSVEHKKKQRELFSLRKWAKEMGLTNHTLLILILQGKRNLTLKQVPHLSKGLGLSTPERMYFQALIQFENAKTDEEKDLLRSWVQDLNPATHYQVKEIDDYLVISHWIHMAILASTFSSRGLKSVETLIRMFHSRLPSIEIHAAFERLKDLGLLQWSDEKQRYLATYQRTTTRDDVANRGAREYHKQVSELAIRSIEEQEPSIREFQSFAINVPSQKITTIKEMMRKFRSQVEAELRTHDEPIAHEGDELYQMNLQFFRLTDQPWSENSKVPADTGARPHSSAELAAEIDKNEEKNETNH